MLQLEPEISYSQPVQFSSPDIKQSGNEHTLAWDTPQQKTILVVDDSHLMRTSLRQTLEGEGYQVLEACNGTECLQSYQRYQPDLILLDALMPLMDGFTCCRHLTRLIGQRRTPILMVTSLEDQESIDRAFTAGATDYITKPIQWAVLSQRIRRLLEQVCLYQQVQQFNIELETQMQHCMVEMRSQTYLLRQSLEFEATLKRITDKVRDSLDESQILQTCVQELAWALNLGCCNASLYDLEKGISSVQYEYNASISGYKGRVVYHERFPELYQSLKAGQSLQFCSLLPHNARQRVAMAAFPIQNGHGVVGDLWLINPEDRVLDELETRLVEQVANQCAIALRQAHLYQQAQMKVNELERLNRLKDDFLSTVSHELRSPVSNMRLAIQMLENSLNETQQICSTQGYSASSCHRNGAYLKVLRNECEREISLINDLLDLQRLEADKLPTHRVEIHLASWVNFIIQPFLERIQLQQQTLQISIQPDINTIAVDSLALERILVELLTNACKYSPPRGEVEVNISRAEPGRLRLVVCNSGIEIPSEELPHIFDKFYRIPNGDPWKQGGTGLGLALVKQLVHHMNGDISVESGLGKTCFKVEIADGLTPIPVTC